MTSYELKINRTLHLATYPLLTFVVIGGLFYYGGMFENRRLVNDFILIIVAIALVSLTIPQILIAYNYYLASKDIKVEIDNLSKMISFEKFGITKRFSFSDVKSITKHRNKGDWSLDFYYFVIELRNKEVILVTSLMTKKDTLDITEVFEKLDVVDRWPTINRRQENVLNFITSTT